MNAIDTAERAAMPSKHIANIISTLTWDIYLYVTRGLYESHKLVFALMLANKVLLTAGKVRHPGHPVAPAPACRTVTRKADSPDGQVWRQSFVPADIGCLHVQIKAEDVDMFLKGGAALDISSARKKPKVRFPPGAASS